MRINYNIGFHLLMNDVLMLCGSRERAREWFTTENKQLGNRVPLDMVKKGQLGTLMRFVQSLAVVEDVG